MNNPYTAPMAPVDAPPQVYQSAFVSELVLTLLRQTRPWVMFISVLTLLAAGLMLLGGLAMMIMGVVGGAAGSGMGGMSGIGIGILYLVIAIMYLYPGVKLWAYGGSIGRLLHSRASEDLEVALLHQKSFWKFSGIAAIVVVVLYVIGIGAAGVVGYLTASRAASHAVPMSK